MKMLLKVTTALIWVAALSDGSQAAFDARTNENWLVQTNPEHFVSSVFKQLDDSFIRLQKLYATGHWPFGISVSAPHGLDTFNERFYTLVNARGEGGSDYLSELDYATLPYFMGSVDSPKSDLFRVAIGNHMQRHIYREGEYFQNTLEISRAFPDGNIPQWIPSAKVISISLHALLEALNSAWPIDLFVPPSIDLKTYYINRAKLLLRLHKNFQYETKPFHAEVRRLLRVGLQSWSNDVRNHFLSENERKSAYRPDLEPIFHKMTKEIQSTLDADCGGFF